MQRNLFNILIILLGVTSCSSPKTLAPVKDHTQPPSTKVAVHVVAPGETLYSIAWRYNQDYKQLAKANNIGRSYTIYPGQRIYLDGRKLAAPTARTAVAPNSSKKTPVVKTNTQVASSSRSDRLKKESPVVKKENTKQSHSTAVDWAWPAEGKILKGFQAQNALSKGIDIGGKLGEPVSAAASGTVVYAGEGLRGYGKLIIIKHSDKYLSAYAHNKRLLVKEGDTVKKGEKIATMGQSGTDSVKLHFEIRYDGKPVDPLAHLPSKS